MKWKGSFLRTEKKTLSARLSIERLKKTSHVISWTYHTHNVSFEGINNHTDTFLFTPFSWCRFQFFHMYFFYVGIMPLVIWFYWSAVGIRQTVVVWLPRDLSQAKFEVQFTSRLGSSISLHGA